MEDVLLEREQNCLVHRSCRGTHGAACPKQLPLPLTPGGHHSYSIPPLGSSYILHPTELQCVERHPSYLPLSWSPIEINSNRLIKVSPWIASWSNTAPFHCDLK